MYRSHVLVCGGTGCTSSGCQQIMIALQEELKKNELTEEVAVVQTGCHGLCALGPIMIVYPEASFYSMVKVEDIPEIVSEHLLKGRVVTRLLYNETVTEDGVKSLNDTAFYKKQQRIALRNCGVINPEVIDEYIGTDGKMYGVDMEIAAAFAAKKGYKLVIKNIDFNTILNQVNAGYADIGMAGMTIDATRLATNDFTDTDNLCHSGEG